ncbi:MAG: hypothetical protein DRG76_09545 [Deltaproteobacteria bacterium]|nr:MAG: hypothetical protein DRG76_09545 [Deltaproteobacteria bacterium]
MYLLLFLVFALTYCLSPERGDCNLFCGFHLQYGLSGPHAMPIRVLNMRGPYRYQFQLIITLFRDNCVTFVVVKKYRQWYTAAQRVIGSEI